LRGEQALSRRKKLYEEKIKQAMEHLSMISEDTSTPRNIRRAAKEAMEMLSDENLTPAVRAANAISILDEISQDPNMPVPTRTRIWAILSLLEGIKD